MKDSHDTTNPLAIQRGRDVLYQSLYDAIDSGQLKPGQRVAPLKQLAKQYNISYGTAHSVLQELEEAGLIHREFKKQPIVVGMPQNKTTSQAPDNKSADNSLDQSIAILYDTRDEVKSAIV
ncbi:MAG: GntR family transcriptional regulator, partial [Phycisphaeraceae bacterium JB051]